MSPCLTLGVDAGHLAPMTLVPSREVQVPRRALLFSLAALAAPVVAAFFAPERLASYSALLWLTALLPAFLLAYYRGWRGVATSLALGMATLSLTQAAAAWVGRPPPDLLLGVVAVYIVISLGLGWLAEQLHRDREEAADMAFTDLLTGLPNRRHADIFLRDEFAAAERGRRVAVVLFDLDDFKGYNDEYGHSAGDEALRAFGAVLKANTRRMNLGARYGGEEFLAVLAGSNRQGAAIFAHRVREALVAEGLGDPPLTVSAGVAVYDEGVEDPAELMRTADAALYEAKRSGRNQVKVAGGLPDDPPQPVTSSPGQTNRRRGDPPIEVVGELRSPEEEPVGSMLLVDHDTEATEIVGAMATSLGLEVAVARTAAMAMRCLTREYDLLVADMHLPDGSAQEVVRVARGRWPRLQILALTPLQDARMAVDSVHAGADRTLFKPLDPGQLRSHLSQMMVERSAMMERAVDARPLSAEARSRQAATRDAILRSARAVVTAVEARDPYIRGHEGEVADLAVRLLELYSGDSAPDIDPARLRLACELRDVGKIGVPDQILNKAGALSEEERTVVRAHARTGRRILEPLMDDGVVLDGVAWHHEWWDGSGYPDGLVGQEIPLAARLIALADVMHAMSHDRAFRPALPWSDVVAYLREQRGGRFDPVLTDLVLANLDDFEAAIHDPGERDDSVSGPG